MAKPKLIPLTELKALMKEAGVTREVSELDTSIWDIYFDDQCVVRALFNQRGNGRRCRQNLKAFCLGLIQMREAGEL